MRLLKRALAAAAVLIGVVAVPVQPAHAADPFKVLAFYNGTYDAAHIDFDKEAREWFPQAGAQNGFTWEATTDWSRLSASGLAGYQVIMFLDDAPPANRRAAFQQYMENGGGFLGFHVSAFTTNANDWSWYYNTFLGSGNFATNTWGPTAETLRLGTHPTTAGLPATIPSAVSEWYSWSRDLRQNPDIDILLAVDSTSFPLGTGPKAHEIWHSGYYPVAWTNRKFRMVYFNFGHNDIDYEHRIDTTNRTLSFTLGDPVQDRLIVDALLWLGGRTGR